jgi:hypothetical protein
MFSSENFVSLTMVPTSTPSALRLFKKLGKVHRIGVNHKVNERLPRLPATNVNASLLRGSDLVKIVTSGI